MDLSDAAKSGDYHKTLEALRDELAEAIEQSNSGRDKAALAGRLQDVLEALEITADPEAVSAADEIAARRQRRRQAV